MPAQREGRICFIMQRSQGADTARGGETSPPTSTHDALVKIMLYFHVREKGVKHFFPFPYAGASVAF